jgi:hypothetical protein
MLFHISEEPDIERFVPRPSQYTTDPVVWAISAERLCNYLLPRDCPRVTYYADKNTSADDRVRFLGNSRAVVAVEDLWLNSLKSCRLYCYHLPETTFKCIDDCAGYFVSRVPVAPQRVEVFENVIEELLKRGVELRLLSNLWSLRDAVVASTLQFSMIRMRNASPRRTS